MIIRAKISYYGSIAMKIRSMRKALKVTLQKAVVLWHGKMLPKHFATPAQAASRYPGAFKARKAKTMKAKAKRYGHQRLLEWSGRTKSEISRSITVSGTYRQARGRMSGANRALNFGGRNNMPDMRAELIAVSKEEELQLAAFIDQEMSQHMNESATEVKTV